MIKKKPRFENEYKNELKNFTKLKKKENEKKMSSMNNFLQILEETNLNFFFLYKLPASI